MLYADASTGKDATTHAQAQMRGLRRRYASKYFASKYHAYDMPISCTAHACTAHACTAHVPLIHAPLCSCTYSDGGILSVRALNGILSEEWI
jgi:hypothetical protein